MRYIEGGVRSFKCFVVLRVSTYSVVSIYRKSLEIFIAAAHTFNHLMFLVFRCSHLNLLFKSRVLSNLPYTGKIVKSVNCWNTLRANNPTTRPVMVSVTGQKVIGLGDQQPSLLGTGGRFNEQVMESRPDSKNPRAHSSKEMICSNLNRDIKQVSLNNLPINNLFLRIHRQVG